MPSLAIVAPAGAQRAQPDIADLRDEAARRVRECERRIEEQRQHIGGLALVGDTTTEACFDLHRMQLLLAVLNEMRRRIASGGPSAMRAAPLQQVVRQTGGGQPLHTRAGWAGPQTRRLEGHGMRRDGAAVVRLRPRPIPRPGARTIR
jgi:hypothetical protein